MKREVRNVKCKSFQTSHFFKRLDAEDAHRRMAGKTGNR